MYDVGKRCAREIETRTGSERRSATGSGALAVPNGLDSGIHVRFSATPSKGVCLTGIRCGIGWFLLVKGDGLRRDAEGVGRKRRRAAICVWKLEVSQPLIAAREVGLAMDSGVVPQVDIGSASTLKRFVTFYFTNFPPKMSTFLLRKGFEVCGILEDVVVPSKCNSFGEAYGFVRYSNVKDVGKLLKAVNAVWFGNFRIFAKVASFDRASVKVLSRESEGESVEVFGKGTKVAGEGVFKNSSDEAVRGAKGLSVKAVDVDDVVGKDEVTEGKVRVRLLKEADKGTNVVAGEALSVSKGVSEVKVDFVHQEPRCQLGRQPSIQKLLRTYRSCGDDLLWARSGFLANVIHGEAIRVIQLRIEDAGFSDIDVIPLGADRVFIHSASGVYVSAILEGAKDFFALFLTNIRKWDKERVPFLRGAWLRMYGVPLHAWNESFFKLCTLECGRFLRSDSCSVDKERFDYARVLVATPSLEVVNSVAKIVVDGEIVDVRIVEEWGFSFGDDACLFEPDDDSQSSLSDHDAHICQENDFLVNDIVNDLVEEGKVKY